jgi:putative tryptophan/tyrosine transport system substrate-binding protein
VLPFTRRVAVLANANDPFHKLFVEHIQAGAGPMNIEIKPVMVRVADELDADFADLTAWRSEAVIVQPSIAQQRIADLALQYRVPAASPNTAFVGLGGLVSYSADADALHRRCVDFVDKILKGRKPADLPVEEPTKFWMAINLTTAKALRLTVPEKLLAVADEVIE